MAVDTTIPDSSNNVGNDLSAIRENFELLASAQVVDEGSTSDGDYIRYDNGWQICVRVITGESYDLVNGDDVRYSNDINKSYPIDFTQTIYSQVRPYAGNIQGSWAGSPETGTIIHNYEWRYVIMSARDNSVSDVSVLMFAIGRWE